MKYSNEYIRNSLPKDKSSVSSFWVKLIARPLSFPLTFIFANLGISANAISILSGIVSAAGCICLSLSSRVSVWVGIILINMWIVLDCADGNVARVTKQTTRMGEFFDAAYGYIICAFDFIAIGMAAYNFSEMIFGIKSVWPVLIGGMTCACNILPRLVYQKYTVMMMDIKIKENAEYQPENDSFYKPKERKGITYLRLAVDRQIGTSGLFMPFLIVSGTFNCFDIMLAFYTVYLGVSCITTFVLFSYKAYKVNTRNENY